jgi:hypothetical protein
MNTATAQADDQSQLLAELKKLEDSARLFQSEVSTFSQRDQDDKIA